MSNTVRDVIEALEDQGWRVERKSSGFAAKPPSAIGQIVKLGLSFDVDPTVFRNTISHLKREGFEWPPPERKRARAENGGRTTGSITLESRTAPTLAAPISERISIPLPPVKLVPPPPGGMVDPRDDAYRALKDARERLAEVQGAYQTAHETRESAARELATAKNRFDAAFAPREEAR